MLINLPEDKLHNFTVGRASYELKDVSLSDVRVKFYDFDPDVYWFGLKLSSCGCGDIWLHRWQHEDLSEIRKLWKSVYGDTHLPSGIPKTLNDVGLMSDRDYEKVKARKDDGPRQFLGIRGDE